MLFLLPPLGQASSKELLQLCWELPSPTGHLLVSHLPEGQATTKESRLASYLGVLRGQTKALFSPQPSQGFHCQCWDPITSRVVLYLCLIIHQFAKYHN